MLFTYYIGLATLSAKLKYNDDIQSDQRFQNAFQTGERSMGIA